MSLRAHTRRAQIKRLGHGAAVGVGAGFAPDRAPAGLDIRAITFLPAENRDKKQTSIFRGVRWWGHLPLLFITSSHPPPKPKSSESAGKVFRPSIVLFEDEGG